MHLLMKGTLVLLAGALCSCTAPAGSGGKEPQASTAPLAAASSAKIREILVVTKGNGATTQNRSEPVGPDSPISVTVSVTHSGSEVPSISLRLIDLKNGQVLGEKVQPVAANSDSAHFEFKPTQRWSEGRHLLEARLGKTGKVVQREFDVVPSRPAAAAEVDTKS
ncbi:hypothetical protein K6X12_20425 [Xanthomonas euvesicatoria pv. allii]|uniref:hypothetical protein n=1 Tax=Xanthomonas TaxID=338 RepID=UPI00240765ED|nr:hypothetical protein [Xanthomonas euvesicatoria]MCP3041526.1 hypothetical protein [Xanthomonas euvesicatoria pv. allii]MCP3053420.1 hypothetical protein [Xanthomonas euvesicatoria pv. allii]